MDFAGQLVFITGASSGIGRELAKQFAARGANLLLFARREDKLRELVAELPKNIRCVIFAGDVTRRADLDAAVERAHAEVGPVSVVVANAGFGVVGPFSRLTTEDYRRQFETNVFGVIETVYAALPDVRAQRGRIALIGSVHGFVSLPGSSPYGMSKHAVRCLAESLYHELAPDGVTVTHVAPGWVDSNIRRVDNQGAFHENAASRMPWFRVDTDVACREMVRAIARRRREVVVTGHGKFFVFVAMHCSRLLHFIISRLKIRGRTEPK